jgi:hypothetical protein
MANGKLAPVNDNLRITGALNNYYFPIPGTLQIMRGMDISVFVSFADRSSDAWADFVVGVLIFNR